MLLGAPTLPPCDRGTATKVISPAPHNGAPISCRSGEQAGDLTSQTCMSMPFELPLHSHVMSECYDDMPLSSADMHPLLPQGPSEEQALDCACAYLVEALLVEQRVPWEAFRRVV